MPQLFLPAAHSDADLVLASQIAARVDSGELHVAWSPDHGPVVPEVSALVREPAAEHGVLAMILGVVYDLCLALLNRDDRRTILPVSASPAADEPQRKPASDPT